MHLKKLAVRNFGRLRYVGIDFTSKISIFVGANNSVKTSVGHGLQLFTTHGRFDVHDFSARLRPDIDAFGTGEDGRLPARPLVGVVENAVPTSQRLSASNMTLHPDGGRDEFEL